MRPLIIIFSNFGIGGIQKKIVDIVNFLDKHKKELPIYILLRRKTDFDTSFRIKNKKTTIIYYTDWLKVKTPIFFPIFVLFQTWKLKPQAILSFISPFSLCAILSKLAFFWRRIRVVISENHLTSGRVVYFRYPKILFLGIKVFYPLTDSIISFTKACKNDLVNNFSIPKEKVRVIPNWTNFVCQKVAKVDKKYDLIYVGRLSHHKRLDLLLKGLVKLKNYKNNIKLCLVGDGEERDKLENFVIRKNIKKNVDFLGVRYGVENFLIRSRIFIYFTRYKGEGFPSAILEAMALGTPVLTCRFAGVDEIIKEEENGFIFDTQKEFTKKALELLENPRQRKLIGQRTKEYVKKHHSPKNIKYYLESLKLNEG